MFARKSFWCIDETVKQAGYRTFPYHAYVPSFGEWGFVMASRNTYTRQENDREQERDYHNREYSFHRMPPLRVQSRV